VHPIDRPTTGRANVVTGNEVAHAALLQSDGGPIGPQNCRLDVAGDGRLLATTEALIHSRIALGVIGPAVIGGITLAPSATRTTWPLIRNYLVTPCGLSLAQ
jgi:hypothetical protein